MYIHYISFLYNNNKTYVYTSLQEENSLDKDSVKNSLEEIYKKDVKLLLL